ncbi:MAG TPA: AtpZ/AtpI family protein [Planctomycetes bacterium]|nr:AtpZ/AtpI family protein [Planctomycetota bacterium]
MSHSSSSKPEGDPAKAAAMVRLSTLGFQVVLTFIALAFGGNWLDDKFDIAPFGILAGIGLGLVAMVKILLQEGQGPRTVREDEESPGSEDEARSSSAEERE